MTQEFGGDPSQNGVFRSSETGPRDFGQVPTISETINIEVLMCWGALERSFELSGIRKPSKSCKVDKERNINKKPRSFCGFSMGVPARKLGTRAEN